MQDLWSIFFSILVLAFGVFCIIFGGFTAYFGTGRSRSIGGGLVLLGLAGIITVLWFTGVLGFARPMAWEMGLIFEGIVAIFAAIVGGGIALAIFLGAIMKS